MTVARHSVTVELHGHALRCHLGGVRATPISSPRPMRRLSLLVLPFLAAFSLVFGLFYLYSAFQLAQQGFAVRAALVGVFGVVGIALATGIWVARRRVTGVRSAAAPTAPQDGPPA